MNNQNEFPLLVMCRVLQISRSGYYEWLNREESSRNIANRELSKEIGAIFVKSDSTYGSPRVTGELKNRGRLCSPSRVARLMKRAGLKSVHRRKYRVKTTNSNHDQPIADNIISQNFSATRVGEKVGCDITYIETDEGWLFLAVVLDFYSRKSLGYAFSDSLETGIVCEALVKAVGKHALPEELIHHSDRGVQYAARRYRQLLKSLKIIQSMSRTGNCYDNAITESFFHTLKVELVYRRKYHTKKIAILDISNYIENWYNVERLHSALGMVSPTQFIANSVNLNRLAA